MTFDKSNDRTSVTNGVVTVSQLPLDRIAASLRQARSRTGLSLSELAKRAGVAKSTLSQLESGAGNPSLETMWALSVALDVPVAVLLDPPPAAVQVIRAGDGPSDAAEGSSYVATLLSGSPPGARRDLYRITAEPGTPRRSDPHSPGVVEYCVLASGRALVGPTEAPVELEPGDFIAYPGDQPHVFEALTAATSAVLVNEQR